MVLTPAPHVGVDATCPHVSIKSSFSGPLFVLALAGIRQRVVQIKATEEEDLLPFLQAAGLTLDPVCYSLLLRMLADALRCQPPHPGALPEM